MDDRYIFLTKRLGKVEEDRDEYDSKLEMIHFLYKPLSSLWQRLPVVQVSSLSLYSPEATETCL